MNLYLIPYSYSEHIKRRLPSDPRPIVRRAWTETNLQTAQILAHDPKASGKIFVVDLPEDAFEQVKTVPAGLIAGEITSTNVIHGPVTQGRNA